MIDPVPAVPRPPVVEQPVDKAAVLKVIQTNDWKLRQIQFRMERKAQKERL